MNTNNRSIGDRFIRSIRSPIRGLARARDYYVRSMTNLADHFPAAPAAAAYGSLAGEDARSFGFGNRTSGQEDLVELIGFASRRRALAAAEAMRRSRSAVLGRIDEDEICDFSGEVIKVGEILILPRSKSCAGGGRRAAAVAPA